MADNELGLFQWQLGTQSVIQTAVDPTVKLIGAQDGELTPIVETSHVEESRASLVPVYDATVDKINGEATIPGDANFEQITYFLDSMFGIATPGSSPGYERAYAAPIATVPTPRILTATKGSTVDARCLKGGVCNELALKLESNKRFAYEAKLLGHSVEADSLSSLSDSVVNYMHANQASIKVDTWAGTMGATALVPTAYNIELGLNLNWMLQHGIGSANPIAHKINKADPGSNQLKMSLELDSVSAGYYTSILAPSDNTPFRAQVEVGFTLGSLEFVYQYAGYAPEAPKFIGDTDGVATLEFVLNPMYHATFGNWLKMSLTNAVETLA